MSVLALADFKSYLNMTSTTTSDGELQKRLDSAEAAACRRFGAFGADTYTDRVSGGRPVISLPRRPLVSITSMIPVYGGGAVDTTKLYLDRDGGFVEYADGSSFGSDRYSVTYIAGWETVPADLADAVFELGRYLFKPQRMTSRRTSAQTTEQEPGLLGPLPYSVEAVFQRYDGPGIG